MNQLPPIKHAGLPKPDRGRNPSRGRKVSSQPPESGRRVLEPLMGKFKHTEIRVTSEDYPDQVDLAYASVREAIGSPVPRPLGEEIYAVDKSYLDSHNSGHPRIKIDVCADSAQPTPLGVSVGSGFGQPVTRSLSVNNLLTAPTQAMTRHNASVSTRPRSKDRGNLGSKIPLGICRSEGSIPLIVNQSQVQNRTVLQTSTTGEPPRSHHQGLRHAKFDACSVGNVRRLSAEHGSTETAVSDVTCFDLDDRPNTPIPDILSRLSQDLRSGSPISPLTAPITPPNSPQWTPNTSPRSRLMASLTPPPSPNWPMEQSPRHSIRMQLTPPLSPVRRSKSVPKWHAPCIDGSSRAPDGSSRSPGSSPSLPRRLLPLRCDRQEV